MAFKPGKLISFDTEGTGLDVPQKDKPFAVALCNEDGETWYTEWDVDPNTRLPKPSKKDIAYLNKILGNPRVTKIAHNAPYDIQSLSGVGVTVAPPFHDTRIMFKRARSNEYTYELKPLAKRYLKMDDIDETELKDVVKRCRSKVRSKGWNLGEKAVQDYWLPRALAKLQPTIWREHFSPEDATLCQKYCELDTKRTMLLFLLLDSKIGKLERAGYERERRLLPIVLDMERTGWQVYPDKVAETRKKLEGEIREFRRAIDRYALMPLEKYTNHALRVLIYDELELAVDCRCKKCREGKQSVDRDHLELLDHPIADSILGMRNAKDCIDKYLNSFEEYSSPVGKELVLFPKFDQVGAKTFRFSARRPPIQTIPDAAKSKSNMSARQCVGPREGWRWYLVDYESLQVRIFADRARDKVMREALRNGIKPHAAAARVAWNGKNNGPGLKIVTNTVALPDHRLEVLEFCEYNKLLRLVQKNDWTQIAEALLEEYDYDIVNAEKAVGAQQAYSKAKTSFFAVLFGAGVVKLSKSLRCSVSEARDTLRQYKAAVPSIGPYSQKCIRFAKDHGYIVTAYDSVIHVDFGFEYRAVNYDVQGTEADLVKDRMESVSRDVLPKTPIKLLGQIHDELGFAVRVSEDDPKTFLPLIRDCLEDHTGHLSYVDSFPVSVDRVDTYWNERVKIELS